MDKNIVLIGMPGAGKSTIGRALSYKLKMPFVDMDDFIEKKYEMTISEIFEKFGEEYFRKIETETAQYLSKKCKNTIISTGGGVVLNNENIKHLKSSGTIVYICRSVESIISTLNVEKRPLLKSNSQKIYDIYKTRHPLYLKSADICVTNNGHFKDCVENIAEVIKNRKKA